MRLPLSRPPSVLLCLTTVLSLQAVAADEDVVSNLLLSPAPDMIDASWELENSTGDVFRYQVSWVGTEGITATCYVNSLDTDTSACSAPPTLASCTLYTVTVQPQVLDVPSPADTGTSASAAAYTLVGEPPAVTSLQVTEVGSRNLTLQWARPETQCTITEYIFTYEGTTLWCCETIDETQVSVTEFNDNEEVVQTELQDLTPYTTYSIKVAAVTGAGKGENSLPLSTRTDEDVPGAPSSFEAESTNSTTVHLYWYSPEQENGILTQFTVRWWLANDTTEENAMSVPNDKNSCYVSDLKECVLYLFSITASTSVGEGPEALTNGSAMATEPGAPEMVCDEDEWTNYVVWSAPTASCPIDGYDIHYTMDVLWSDDEDSEWLTVPASETAFTLEDTTPYSDYTYKIRAIVAGGLRGSAGTCTIRTPEAAPSAPQNLGLVDRTDYSLIIRWERPAEMNGVVRQYHIQWRSENSTYHSGIVSASSSDVLFVYTISYLASGTGYFVEVRGYTVEDGAPATDEFFTSGLPDAIITDEPFGSTGSSSSTNIVVIAVLSVVAIVVIVVLIVFFIQRENNRRRLRSSPRQLDQQRARGGRPAQNGSQSQILNSIHRFESEPESLTQAFTDLKARSRNGPTTVGQVPQNVPKNRDMNVLPFDDTRVQLSGEAKMASDYINASHVKDAAGRQKIIASQGPTDVTLADFWQMVWQENVNLIVMLTKCQENGEAKCCQYWPDSADDSVSVGAFSVCLRGAALEPGLCRRELGLQNGEYPPRVIRQFHFTHWPERGVPESQAAILQLLDRVRAEDFAENKILVHCSAGDGRSGTLIALWNLQQKALSGETLDVDGTILEMREARQSLIQTESQYLFVYKCIATYLTAIQNRTADGNHFHPSPASGHQIPVQSSTPAPPPPTAQMDAPPSYPALYSNPAFQPSSNSQL